MPPQQSSVELLFKLVANWDGKGVDAARSDLKKLKDDFGNQIASVSLSALDTQLEKLLEEVPLIGPAIAQVTSRVIDLAKEAPELRELQSNLAKIGEASGRSVPEVSNFLTNIKDIADESKRSDEVLRFLGTNLGTKLIPLLNEAASANQKFGSDLNLAARAAGKTDDEIASFSKTMTQANTRADALAATVSFLGAEAAKKLTPSLDAASQSIEKIAKVSNLPAGAISTFVNEFSKLGSAAEKNDAAIGFFGESIAQKLEPELNEAAKGLEGANAASSQFIATLGEMAGALGPVGIAIVGLIVQLALLAGALFAIYEVGKQVVESFFSMAESAAGFREKLFQLSQQTGLTVETLSGLEVLAAKTGSSIDLMSAAILQLQRHIEQAKDPTSESAAILDTLGVTATDTEQALRQTLKGLFDLGKGTTQTTLALQLFGLRGRQILTLIQEAHGDLDAVIKQAKEFGLVVSEEDAEAAEQFSGSMKILELQMRALLGKEVLPFAVAVVKQLSDVLKDSKGAIETAGVAVKLFGALVGFFLIGALRLAVNEIKILSTLLNAVFSTDAPFVTFLINLATSLGIVAKATSETTKEEEKSAKAKEDLRLAAAERVKAGKSELDFLSSLGEETHRSADENAKLEDSYNSLDEETKQRLLLITDETKRLQALIAIKKQLQEQNEFEAKTEKEKNKFLLDQINQNKEAQATHESIRSVESQASKDRLDQIRSQYELGRVTREKVLAEEQKAAEEEHRINIRSLNEKRDLAIKELQLQLNKPKAVRTDADVKADIEKKAALTKVNQEIIEADNKLANERKRIQDDFIKDELNAERQHRENQVSVFQQTARNRIAEITDELQKGDAVRRQVREREINDIKLAVIEADRERKKGQIARLEAEEQTLKQRQVILQKSVTDEAKIERSINEIKLASISKIKEEINSRLSELDEQQFAIAEEQANKRINLLIKIGTQERLLAEEKIKIQEDASIKERRTELQTQLNQTVVASQRQAINDKLTALAVEETEVQRQQSLRKEKIIRDERDAVVSILLDEGEEKLRAVEAIESRVTEQAKHQADLRIITEETAAKRIIESRKRLLDAQIILVQAQQKAAETIDDPVQRAKREEELLNALRELRRARTQLELDSVGQLQDARTKDLDNERRYIDELLRLQGRLVSSQRDAVRTIISNLILSNSRRRELIRSQIDLDISEQEERSRIAKENLAKEILAKDERVRFLEQHLRTLTVLRKTEGDDFRDANEERLRLLEELRILHQTEETENTRHLIATSKALEMLRSGLFTNREILNQLEIEKGIEEIRHRNVLESLEKRKKELERKKELDAKELEQLKNINKQIEDENERHRLKVEQQKGTQKTAETPSLVQGIFEGLGESPIKKQGDELKQLGKIGGEVFKGMANAIGGLVQQWVLYGTTGPAALRKVVAAALAAFASQAAVAALMELAYGFAALTPWGALVYGPAILHFKAAAFFAAAAAIAGVAGRAVAGNTFSQGAGAGGGGGAGQTRTETPPKPIDIARDQAKTEIHLFLHAEPGPGFNQHVVQALVNDVRQNGDARNIIIHTAGEA